MQLYKDMQNQIRDKISYTPQQQAAIDCRLNCAVSAGAGSGKTKVLTQRFVNLVKEGTDCNRILTITFTRKATSEMKERIHSALVDEGLIEQLELFPKASICTVDSFCLDVARTDCQRFGFTPDFRMSDEYDFAKEVKFLASQYLRDIKNNQALKLLLNKKSVEDVQSMLVQSALLSDPVKPFNAKEYSSKYIEAADKIRKKAEENAKQAAFDYIEHLSQDPKLEDNVRQLTSFTEGHLDLGQICFSSARGTGKDNQALASELKKTIVQSAEDARIALFTLEDSLFIEETYEFVSNFVQKVIRYKRKTSQVSFNDVMKMSLDILANNTGVRAYFKSKFDYVMVDEFQDNNNDHRDLVYLLCEKDELLLPGIPRPENLKQGKLFLVGDDKQSIYRFRGADVSVFNRICRELEQNGGRVLELGVNFRSTPVLINHFSELYEKVMDNPFNDFEAKFRKLDYNKDGEFPVKSRVVYHCWHGSQDEITVEKAGKTESEAYSIANLIENMVSTDDWLISNKDGCPVRPKYSDIAVLLRTGGNQSDFEKALRLRSIPYTLTEAKALMREALVNDFYSILSSAVYPHDAISFKACLNGPLGLALDDDAIAQIPLNSITESLRFIWYKLGYRLFIISNPANQVFEEHFNWLYGLAAIFETSGKSVIEFLDYLRPLIGQNEKLMEVPEFTEDSDGVQIMTIHKSKGLEFPIVIIASMESKVKNDTANRVSSSDDIIWLPLSRTEDSKLANLRIVQDKEVEKQRENAELKRLFYVASTRAKCHLVYSACPGEKLNTDTPDSLAGLLEKSFPLAQELETMEFELIDRENTFSTSRLDLKTLKRAGEYYKNPKNEDFDWTSLHHRVTEEELSQETFKVLAKLPTFEWDEEIEDKALQAEFGTLVHGIIQRRILNGNFAPVTDLEKHADDMAKMFFESPAYQKVCNMKLWSERAFEVADGDDITDGIIDLLAEDDEKAIIYDFKTDRYKVPEVHRKQLETYADAVKRMYPDKKVESWVIYLRNPDESVRIV